MTDSEPERIGEVDRAATAANTATNEVEEQIRTFLRHDFHRRHSDVAIDFAARLRPATNDVAVDAVNSVIDRVAGASVSEIERVIAELASVRDKLRKEGERVQRQLESFASLNQAAMTSMKIIAESLEHWKSQTPGQSEG
jgi:hypothetical protein